MTYRTAGLMGLLLSGCTTEQQLADLPDVTAEAGRTADHGGLDAACDATTVALGALQVRTGGDDATATGSVRAPFGTIGAALAHHEAAYPAPTPTCQVLDFDTDASGDALQHGENAENAYADWGVSITVTHKNGKNDATGISSSGALARAKKDRDVDGDGLADDPQPAPQGALFTFDFDTDRCVSGLTFATLTDVATLTYLDSAGNTLHSATRNTAGTITNEVCGVRTLTVHLNGVGSIDNLQLCEELAPHSVPPAVVQLGSGEYEANVAVGAGQTVTVLGCSVEKTTVTSANSFEPIFLAEQGSLTVRSVALSGGLPAVWARSEAQVSLSKVRIVDSKLVGLAVTDGATLSGDQVTVIEPRQTSGHDMGWGVGVVNAEISLKNLLIQGAHEVGLFGDKAVVTLENADIMDTQTTSRIARTRGIHLQNGSDAVLYDTRLTRNGIGLLGLDMSFLQADNILIDITGQGITFDPSTGILIDITGQGFQTWGAGDGIVLVDHSGFAAPIFLSNNVIKDTERAAMVLDGVDATLDNNTSSNVGYTVDGKAMFMQGNTVVSGTDAGAVQSLAQGEELAVHNKPVQMRLTE